MQKSVDTWIGQLVDLGGRNNMLYYRDLKQGTLDLSTVEPQVRTELLAGKAIRLSRLFPAEDERETTKRRVRTIRNKAQENFEERGLQTLYLACGMAKLGKPPRNRETTSACTPRVDEHHHGRSVARGVLVQPVR